jgi:lipopolysaccharide export system ATP-binding protein
MSVIKKFIIKSFKKQKPIISLKNISISFNKNHQILDHVSLDISKGQVLGLLGPNGAGKSTLMNIISGLLKPSSGTVYINGKNVTDYPVSLRSKEFKLSIVPQTGGYFESLSAESNLLAIGEILIPDEKKRINRIEQLISKFELDSVRNVEAKFLSGGLKRRLVIAMSLIGEPEILLMDEPLAALDPQTIQMLQNIIVTLQTEFNLTILVTDHQAADLLRVCDKALILSNSKIVAAGSPRELINNEIAHKHYFGTGFRYK